jgi:hypothetical protein
MPNLSRIPKKNPRKDFGNDFEKPHFEQMICELLTNMKNLHICTYIHTPNIK